MTWKTALTRAINAEVAAEQAATQAEDERRRTWWDTTWALASVPRAEVSEAVEQYTVKLGHSASHAKKRRMTGERFPQSVLANTLPMPRFAQAAADWLGAKPDEAKVAEAIKLLADAEKNEQSLREFNLALTGKSWTNAPENMTEAEENAVVAKVAKQRPAVVAQQVAVPAVAASVITNPTAKKQVIRQQSASTQRKITARRAAVTAAGPDTKGQVAGAVNAGQTAMDNTPGYTRVNSGQGQMVSAWVEFTTGQDEFNDLDLNMFMADQASLERHVAERRVVVEAYAEGQDWRAALAAHRAEAQEEFHRQADAAEMGVDIDAGLDDLETFANEGI